MTKRADPCVYFAQLGNGAVKVGSTRDLNRRQRELYRDYGPYRMLHVISTDRPTTLEAFLLRMWRGREVGGKEVLGLSDDDIRLVRQVSRVTYGDRPPASHRPRCKCVNCVRYRAKKGAAAMPAR